MPWPGRLALVALLWLLGGRAGLLAGLALVVYDAVRSPSPRELLVGSVVLLAAVVLAGNLVAHVLAGLGLALLVLGVLRDVRVGRPAAHDPAGERALVLRRPDPANGDRTP